MATLVVLRATAKAPATPPDPNQPRGDDIGGDEDIEIGDYDMDDIVQQAPPGYDPFPHSTVPNVLHGLSMAVPTSLFWRLSLRT